MINILFIIRYKCFYYRSREGWGNIISSKHHHLHYQVSLNYTMRTDLISRNKN